jgi:hypothetical protein
MPKDPIFATIPKNEVNSSTYYCADLKRPPKRQLHENCEGCDHVINGLCVYVFEPRQRKFPCFFKEYVQAGGFDGQYGKTVNNYVTEKVLSVKNDKGSDQMFLEMPYRKIRAYTTRLNRLKTIIKPLVNILPSEIQIVKGSIKVPNHSMRQVIYAIDVSELFEIKTNYDLCSKNNVDKNIERQIWSEISSEDACNYELDRTVYFYNLIEDEVEKERYAILRKKKDEEKEEVIS